MGKIGGRCWQGDVESVIFSFMARVDPTARKKKATYEDLVDLPSNVVGELFSGELIVSPRPSPRHAHSSSALGMKLGPPFQFGDGGPGGWWLLDEPELHLGDDVLVPDIAGWRRERLKALPDKAWIDMAPDWVCEVISPTTARVDRVFKLPIYAKASVRHVWLLDPAKEACTLEIFRLKEGAYLLVSTHAGEEQVRAEPFSEIVLDLAALWAD